MKRFKKPLSILLSLVMVLGVFAAVPFTVSAQEAVTYTEYSWNGSALETTPKTVTNYTVANSSLSSMTSGTYVVNTDTTIEDYVTVQKGATADLVVMDGVTLTCNKGIGCGLNKNNEYASLNIFGTGKIVATGKGKAAGIGGDDDETNGNITIHGTTVEATGGNHGAGIGGGEGGKDPDDKVSIKIFAGDITAKGGVDGAGIGGGDEQQGAKTYIYGGKITASSEKHGAGIGGGDEENTRGIYIYGGKTEATGGSHGAGIGAGEHGGNIHEIKITGGEIEARGGKGGAGIGGGFDEDMSGEIDISGDVNLTAIAGEGGAGIGAGAGAEWYPDGDMDGTIRINGGPNSVISVYGLSKKLHNYGTAMFASTYDKEFRGYNGAGIGAGYGGNMGGKVYLTGGNMWIWSGVGGAGIGGGCENWQTGGEGGDVYIGGGNINVYAIIYSAGGSNTFGYKTHNSAIGAGDNDYKEGSVYIHPDNNTTGKYMKVIREPLGDYMDDFKPEVTEIAADRSKKCHTTSWLTISECDHKDHNGNSGLTYTIDGDTHTVKCKYCGYKATVAHSGSDCECGYRSDTCTVHISDDSGLSSATVARNGKFALPDDGDRVLSTNTNPSLYYRVKGWTLSGDTSGKVYEPGETVTVDRDMVFTSEREYLYQVSFDAITHGSIHADITNNETYAAVGETLEFGVDADPGYSVSKVTYRKVTDYDLDDSYNIVYQYSDPVEIQPVDGKYQLTMPEFSASYNNKIVISAEVTANAVNPIYISESIENGTVTSDKETAAPNSTVTLTVTPDEDFFLYNLRCRAWNGSDIELTKVDDTHYTFIMPAMSVSVSAEFESAGPYNINTSIYGNGTLTVDKEKAMYNERVTMTATPDEGWELIALYVIYEGGHLFKESENTFIMPNCDVTIIAHFDKPTPYIDADGTEKSVLTSDFDPRALEIYSSNGWYAITEDITLDHELVLNGNFHLILCDGATLNLVEGESDYGKLTVANDSSLTIYGQEKGTGRIASNIEDADIIYYKDWTGYSTTFTMNGGMIEANEFGRITAHNVTVNRGTIENCHIMSNYDLVVNGGTIEADFDTEECMLFSWYDIIINGGTLRADLDYPCLVGYYNIIINGGDIGLCSTNDDYAAVWTNAVTLSWSSLSDVYTVSSYGTDESGDITLEKDFVDNNGNVYPAGSYDHSELNGKTLRPYDGMGVKLAGHSISLDGDIAVNFYIELSQDVIESANNPYMLFNVPNTSTEYQTQKVYLTEAEPKGDYYLFKCRVAAKDMESLISAQLIDGNNKSIVYTYSVKEYADYLLDNANDQHPDYLAAKPLVEAMLQYGRYAANHFGNEDALSDIDATIPEKDYTATGIAETLFDGATLSLKSQTTLSLYFVSAQELTLSMEDKTEGVDYETDHKGNEYVIRIRNISAAELNDDFTVTVTAGEESGIVTYSPTTYCYKAQTSSNAKLVNTVKALYNYYLAAYNFFDRRCICE